MKITTTIILLFLQIQLFSQTFREVELEISLDEVTVFLQNANITRAGSVEIPTGKSKLVVKSLSPYMDKKSIQIKGEGDFTILSVNHKHNYLDELSKDAKIDSLQKHFDSHNSELEAKENRLEILKEKQSLLNENKKLGGTNTGLSLVDLKQAIDFYDKELSEDGSPLIGATVRIKGSTLGTLRMKREDIP